MDFGLFSGPAAAGAAASAGAASAAGAGAAAGAGLSAGLSAATVGSSGLALASGAGAGAATLAGASTVPTVLASGAGAAGASASAGGLSSLLYGSTLASGIETSGLIGSGGSFAAGQAAGTALTAAGMGLGASSAIQQAKTAKATTEANNAWSSLNAATRRVQNKKKLNRSLGQLQSIYAASGTNMGQGSALGLQNSLINESDEYGGLLDASATYERGRSNADYALAKNRAYGAAGQSLLSGFGNSRKLYGWG